MNGVKEEGGDVMMRHASSLSEDSSAYKQPCIIYKKKNLSFYQVRVNQLKA